MSVAAVIPQMAPSAPVHTISILVRNKPGVLVRVALVFSRRGFNIESLVVSPGAEGRFSRMTIVSSGNSRDLGQIILQLAKLVDVVHAIDHTGDDSYETEIALVKLFAPLDQRTQILQIHGPSEKLDAFIDLLRPFKLPEIVRSGKLLMARGVRVT